MVSFSAIQENTRNCNTRILFRSTLIIRDKICSKELWRICSSNYIWHIVDITKP